jgi:RNA polymerase sigma factor (sigma-70 family)
MVLGLCRRLLRHEADAEDAFQATFLVLARNAASIRKRSSVAGWLYGVAARVASRARAVAGRLRLQSAEILDTVPARPEPGADQRDLQAVVHEELCRLPEADRAVVVLCYLQGKTHREAAAELGWARGSVARRLKAALARLRAGLRGRGLTFAVGAVAAALSRSATSAGGVSADSVQFLVRGATEVAAGRCGAGLFSAQAAGLAEGEMGMLGWTRIKTVVAACLALALIITSGGLLLVRAADDRQPDSRTPEVARHGVIPKGKRDPRRALKIPLDRKALLDALRHSDIVFVGRVAKADLSEGWWSGWAMCTRAVTYEVTLTLRGEAKKAQTVQYIVLRPGEHIALDSPRLEPRLFARGAEHVVLCTRDGGNGQFVQFMSPAVHEAVAVIQLQCPSR